MRRGAGHHVELAHVFADAHVGVAVALAFQVFVESAQGGNELLVIADLFLPEREFLAGRHIELRGNDISFFERVVWFSPIEEQHVARLTQLALKRDDGVFLVSVVAHAYAVGGIATRSVRTEDMPVLLSDDLPLIQQEVLHHVQVETLLIHRTVTIVVGVLRPCIGAIVTREIRVGPGAAHRARAESCQVRVDSDCHDRRLAATVHHLTIGKGRLPGGDLNPRVGIRIVFRWAALRGVRSKIKHGKRTVGLIRWILGPEEVTSSAGAHIENQRHLDGIFDVNWLFLPLGVVIDASHRASFPSCLFVVCVLAVVLDQLGSPAIVAQVSSAPLKLE